MGAEPIPHELLLRHAGFLRRLARDLVGDPSAAEDAVQEVWLRALEKPPRHGANVRGWLRVVLTNLVRSKARGESRREARERDRAVDPAGALLSTNPNDEATLRFVTEAVLALEEPLRSTVLQHYFQGLTAAEIATRDHLPVSTVKSRLQRALEILRARMQREQGSTWVNRMAALAWPVDQAHQIPIAAAGKGVVPMVAILKVASSAALLFGVWLLVRETTPVADEPSSAASSRGVGTVASSSTVTASGGRPTSGRIELDTSWPRPSTASSASTTNEPQVQLVGRLVAVDGIPIGESRGGKVVLTDVLGQRSVTHPSEAGSFEFRVLNGGEYWMRAEAAGYRSQEQHFSISNTQHAPERIFTLAPCATVSVFVTTPDGHSLLDQVRSDPELSAGTLLVPVVTRSQPPERMSEIRNVRTNMTCLLAGSFGIGHFSPPGDSVASTSPDFLGTLSLEDDQPAFVSLFNYQRLLDSHELAPSSGQVRFVVSLDRLRESFASVRARLVDADSNSPLPPSALFWGGAARVGWDGSVVDSEGALFVRAIAPGTYVVRFNAPDHEDYWISTELGPGVRDLGQIDLSRRMKVQVQLVDEKGRPTSPIVKLGVVDRSVGSVSMDIVPFGGSPIVLERMGRHVYILRTVNYDSMRDDDPYESRKKSVLGDYVLDLSSGSAPAALEIPLVHPTFLTLRVVTGRVADHGFRLMSSRGDTLLEERFVGEAPRLLTLPSGSYRVELLDSQGVTLSRTSVDLGTTPVTVELSR